MHQSHLRGSFKTKEQERHDDHRELAKSQNAAYDGETAEYGYSQMVMDLLKDPVSLGMQGGNSNRGRQR